MDFMTVQQVADAAEVSNVTILRMIKSGRLPAHRFNRRTFLIKTEDAQEFLDNYEPYDTLRKDTR